LPRESGGRRKLVILIALFLIIAMTLGYLAYLLKGLTGILGGGGGGSAHLSGCDWRGRINMSSSYIPGYDTVFAAMNISRLAPGDYNLTIILANEGGQIVDLTQQLAGGSNNTPKLTILFFDKYGDAERRNLAVSSASVRILPQNQVKYEFTLTGVGERVYTILYFHNLPLRLGAWLQDPAHLAGSCGEYVENPTRETVLYARWATLAEGLTVLEAILYSNASAPVEVAYTGAAANQTPTLFTAEIYDPYNYLVQRMASPPLANTTRYKIPPNGYQVLGVAAGQIWGEPAKLKLDFNMTIDGHAAEGYEGDYSKAGWTSHKPGMWVVKGYSRTLSNGLEYTMTYAYNGYILVIRDASITNPTDHTLLMPAKASLSPIRGIPLPALKIRVLTQNDTALDGGWTLLSMQGLHINKTEGEEENTVFYYELPPGASVPIRGVVTYKALYGEAGKLEITTPWGEIITLYFDDIYQPVETSSP